jgi:AmiR/NasT family two-component response regulator
MSGGLYFGGSVECQRGTDGACPWAGDLAAELEVAHRKLRGAEEELRGHRDEIERLTALTGQLEEAMASRPVIDQAKGVIVAQTGYDPERAFRRLVAVSRHRHVKVRDVARAVVVRAQRPGRSRMGRRRRGSSA